MKKYNTFLWVLVGLTCLSGLQPSWAGSGLIPHALRCEYRVNPQGIDEWHPRLGWQLRAEGRGKKQSAYRILVASREELLNPGQADLWDSDEVFSDRSIQIEYQGKPLQSFIDCYWRVQVWDETGTPSPWSEIASWSMGILNASEWQAKWVGVQEQGIPEIYIQAGSESKTKQRYPVRMFRKEFSVEKPMHRAMLYATAMGIYEFYINGRRVGDDFFAPGWPEYDRRLYYRSYDVTELLETGSVNAIGALLGDGWYTLRFSGQGKEILKAQLRIEFKDGSSETLGTDESWLSFADGPIRMSDMFDGEVYDARKELPGWTTSGFPAHGWKPAIVKQEIEVPLTAHPGMPVQKTDMIRPIDVQEVKAGMYVFDMGQNMVGWAKLRVVGKSGQRIQLRFAERLNPDGTIYTKNLRTAKATDIYICQNDKMAEWEPRFTFHGFRYVELTGYPGIPDVNSLTGIVLRSNAPETSSFECSNPMVNKLYKNILWGQRGNYFEIPTDCPQRDERKGWTGDAQAFIQTGAYNMDIASFYTAWLETVNDCFEKYGIYPRYAPTKTGMPDDVPRAGWGDAGIICPWTLYRMYDDTRILERHYDHMAQWIDILEVHTRPFFDPPADYASNYEYDQKGETGFGDWLNQDGDYPTRKYVINAAYYGYVTNLMIKIARALDKKEDEKKFLKVFNHIKRRFNDVFVKDDARILGDTQTTYLMALYFDLLPDSLRQNAFAHLIRHIEHNNGHLSTGFLGVNFLLPVLSEFGRTDIAYRLLQNTTFPSWGYMIENGATTIWERWDGWTQENGFFDPSMNSFNHYVFGACGQWLFSDMAGIETRGPGFKNILIRPRIDKSMGYVKARYHSIHGEISVYWKNQKNKFYLEITVPANTSAEVHVPATSEKDIRESQWSLDKVQHAELDSFSQGIAKIKVGSGHYVFESGI